MARLLLVGRIMRNIVLCSMLVVLASPSVLAAQAGGDASQGHRHDQSISSNAPPEEEDARWDRRKLTVSAGLGFFSPTGFAAGGGEEPGMRIILTDDAVFVRWPTRVPLVLAYWPGRAAFLDWGAWSGRVVIGRA